VTLELEEGTAFGPPAPALTDPHQHPYPPPSLFPSTESRDLP